MKTERCVRKEWNALNDCRIEVKLRGKRKEGEGRESKRKKKYIVNEALALLVEPGDESVSVLHVEKLHLPGHSGRCRDMRFRGVTV